MNVRLDTPSPAELPRLVAIWQAATDTSHDFLPAEDLQVIAPLLPTVYFPRMQLLCARDTQQQVQGFLGHAGERLEMLYVDPAWQRQGIGRRLLRHAVERLGVCRVDLYEQNLPALAFYREHGFAQIARSPCDGGGRSLPILHLRLTSD